MKIVLKSNFPLRLQSEPWWRR